MANSTEPEINAFLSNPVEENVSALTPDQAPWASQFLYRHVLEGDVGDVGKVLRKVVAKAVRDGDRAGG